MIKDDKGKTQQGWWNGTGWDFYPKKISEKVEKWRVLKSRERVSKNKEATYDQLEN